MVQTAKSKIFSSRLTPAVLAYEGIQYQYMAPSVFTENQWEYAQKNLRDFIWALRDFKTYGRSDSLSVGNADKDWKRFQIHGKSGICMNFWEEDIYRELVKEERINF